MRENKKWADWFYYDETSPTCLRWAVERRGGKNYNVLIKAVGDQAGTFNGCMYAQVGLQLKTEYVHRVIWELFNGEIPEGMQIDHKDGDRRNNRISNLRLVPAKLNSKNNRKRSDNSSGVTGVWLTEPQGYAYWCAEYQDESGKSRKKCFSVLKLGEEAALEAAKSYRRMAVAKLNAEGAGYTERHGT